MDKIPINPNFSSEKEKAIDSEIEKLLKKGVRNENMKRENISLPYLFPLK